MGKAGILAVVALLAPAAAHAASVDVVRYQQGGFALTRFDPGSLTPLGKPLDLASPNASGAPNAFDRAPDGKRFAVIGATGKLLLFDDAKNTPTATVPVKSANTLAWPTDRRLIAFDFGLDPVAKAFIVDPVAGKLLKTVKLPGEERLGGALVGTRVVSYLETKKEKLRLAFISTSGSVRTVDLPKLPAGEGIRGSVLPVGRDVVVQAPSRRRAAVVDDRTYRVRYVAEPKSVEPQAALLDLGSRSVFGVSHQIKDGSDYEALSLKTFKRAFALPEDVTAAMPGGLVGGTGSRVHGYSSAGKLRWTAKVQDVDEVEAQGGVVYVRGELKGANDSLTALNPATGKVLATGTVKSGGLFALPEMGGPGESFSGLEDDGD